MSLRGGRIQPTVDEPGLRFHFAADDPAFRNPAARRAASARSENVGPVTYRELIGRFESAGAALAALPELARRGGRKRPIRIFSRDKAEAEIAAFKAMDATLFALGEPAYPAPLAAIPDPPPLFAARGQLQLLERAAVAIVGARNASASGVRFARTLAGELVVVSGLARGIDTAAHEGALVAGTIAVVAGAAPTSSTRRKTRR